MAVNLNSLIIYMQNPYSKFYYDPLHDAFYSENELDDISVFFQVPKITNEQYIEMCKHFAYDLNNKTISKKILNEIPGSKNFEKVMGRFHNLAERLGIWEDYNKFVEQEIMGIAKSWCEKNNLKYTRKK